MLDIQCPPEVLITVLLQQALPQVAMPLGIATVQPLSKPA